MLLSRVPKGKKHTLLGARAQGQASTANDDCGAAPMGRETRGPADALGSQPAQAAEDASSGDDWRAADEDAEEDSEEDEEEEAHEQRLNGQVSGTVDLRISLRRDHQRCEGIFADAHWAGGYPEHLCIATEAGDKIAALALLPTEEDATPISEESILRNHGIFRDVPVEPSKMISTKQANSARAAMNAGRPWKPTLTGKDASQLGPGVYKPIIEDLVRHSKRKALYFVAPFDGPDAALGKAILQAKCGASGSEVMLFYQGHEHRRVPFAYAKASLQELAARLYHSGQLKIDDRTPARHPGAVPGRSKTLMQSLLREPLRFCSLTPEGFLAIPPNEKLFSMLQIVPTPELEEQIAKWRTAFPGVTPPQSTMPDQSRSVPEAATRVPLDAQPGTITTGAASANAAEEASGESGGEDETLPPVSTTDSVTVVPGTQAAHRQELERMLKEKVVASCAVNGKGLRLVLTSVPQPEGSEGRPEHRLWLENANAEQALVLPAGTFIGRGGPGKICNVALTDLPPEEKERAVAFTRLSSWKTDSHKWANGGIVFMPGAPGREPTLRTMADVEKASGVQYLVYAHTVSRRAGSCIIAPGRVQCMWVAKERTTEAVIGEDGKKFNNLSLNTWLPCMEKQSKTKFTCTGSLRPAFELHVSQDSPEGTAMLQPNKASAANHVCWFTARRLELQPRQLSALH